MSEKKNRKGSEADEALQREILEGRKFTLEEAIARMAGPGSMKGESPVARKRQAEIEIETWLATHLPDAGGTLRVVLYRHVAGSEVFLNKFEQPLVVLAAYCQHVLDSDYLLKEIVREADVEWGRVMGERPVFETTGRPPQPDDPYTIESVRTTLSKLIEEVLPQRREDAK